MVRKKQAPSLRHEAIDPAYLSFASERPFEKLA